MNEVKDIMVKNIGELLVESKATPKNAESVLKLIDRQQLGRRLVCSLREYIGKHCFQNIKIISTCAKK